MEKIKNKKSNDFLFDNSKPKKIYKNRKDLVNFKDLDKSSKTAKEKNMNAISSFLKDNNFERTKELVEQSNNNLINDVLKDEYKHYFSKDKDFSFAGFEQYKTDNIARVSQYLVLEHFTEKQMTGFTLLNKRLK